MKRSIWFLAACSFFFFQPAFSQETNIGIDVDTQTYQQQTGGTQTFTYAPVNNSPDQVQHSISAQVDPNLMYVSPLSSGKPIIWHEVYSYAPDDILTPEEIREHEDGGGFILHWTKKKFVIEKNNDHVRVLDLIPAGPNDRVLWSVQAETAPNAFLKEEIDYLVSKVRNATNTRRVLVTVELQLNPQVAGNSFGMAGGASGFIGTTANAVGVSPMMGKSESRVYDIYHITVTGYNDGISNSIPNSRPATTKLSPPKQDIPWIIYLNNDLSMQEPQGVPYNVEWIKRNWDKIQGMKGKINIICKGLPGSEKDLEDKARQAMIEMGRTLVSQNFVSAQNLEQIMKYGYDTNISSQEISKLQKQNATGVMILSITK